MLRQFDEIISFQTVSFIKPLFKKTILSLHLLQNHLQGHKYL